MSLFSSNYLMNIEKYKINNKNKKNKYITSKPSFLITSKTYRYFKDKENNDKKVNMTLTSNNFNINENQVKNNISNYNIKTPMNNNLIINKNTKKYYKNKYNTNTYTINDNKNKTDRNININIDKENINPNNINNNYKKINIKQRKKGRTLSSNINKIIKENIENIEALKTYRNTTRKDRDLILNEYKPNHKKSNSIIISENNLNLFPSNKNKKINHI